MRSLSLHFFNLFDLNLKLGVKFLNLFELRLNLSNNAKDLLDLTILVSNSKGSLNDSLQEVLRKLLSLYELSPKGSDQFLIEMTRHANYLLCKLCGGLELVQFLVVMLNLSSYLYLLLLGESGICRRGGLLMNTHDH